jgi:hypothetical protein
LVHDESKEPIGFIARLLSDPIRLRRWAAIALLVLAPLAGFAHAAHLGNRTGLLIAIVWIVMPFVALAIGIGDAFFLQYGRGRRRVVLTLLASTIVALGSCVVLAGISEASQSTGTRITEGIGYGMLYIAFTLGLASLLALILGVGREYVSERIMRMSRDDW